MSDKHKKSILDNCYLQHEEINGEEQNALIQAARFGISLEGATLYCRIEPCRTCAMSIVGAGIKRVVCEKKYHAAEDTREIFAKCGVELVVLHDELEQYENI